MIARLAWIKTLIAERARYRMALEIIAHDGGGNSQRLIMVGRQALNNKDMA